MARHLMLAMTPTAFGEAVLGMRIARELRERGHEVRLLAPSALRRIAEDAGVRFGAIDDALPTLDRVLAGVVGEHQPASLTLLDAASVIQAFATLRLDPSVFSRIATRVIALDIWNIDESGLAWDHAGGSIQMDPRVATLRRIVPVPFARPSVANGYNALPAAPQIDRRAIRASLGIGDGERVVFWPTAKWQAPRFQTTPRARAIAERVPDLIASYLAALGPAVRVVQVGPEPLRAGATLGARFVWLPQQSASRFHALLAASDVMLGANLAATTLPSAIACEVPTVVIENARVETASAAAGPLGDRARRWLETGPPLYPFRVWPAGLHAMLSPVMRDNPMLEAIDVVELLDEESVIGRLRALLFDDAAAALARRRQAAYRAAVSALPDGATRFEGVLAEAT